MTEKYTLDEEGKEERISIYKLVIKTLMVGARGWGWGQLAERKLVSRGFFLLIPPGSIASRSSKKELVVGGRMLLTEVEK